MSGTARAISSRDDPAKSCLVEVYGSNHVAMQIEAKKIAARFLSESFDDLVADSSGTASPTAYDRFVPHLGVAAAPIRWRMAVTVRLKPEIVRARRDAARAMASAEHPRAPEDEE